VLHWLRRHFNKAEWDLSSLSLPWDADRPAIAAFLGEHLQADGTALVDSELPLPDEDRVSGPTGLRYAPGARDGIALFHTTGVSEPDVTAEVLGLLWVVLADDGLQRLPDLYAALVGHRALSWVDELGAGIVEKSPDPARVYALALLLANLSPDREAVKAGIALLGMLSLDEGDLSLLRLLGSHDEFTLYVAVAIGSQVEDAERELFALAGRTVGWGRIHAVLRIADSEDPQIRGWLLREGYHNSVMDRYLALPCARGARLDEALADVRIDEWLLAGGGRILAALVEEDGPTPGMEAWDEGAAATLRWLHHVQPETAPIATLPTLAALVEAAGRGDPPWGRDAAAAIGLQAHALLADEAWPDRVGTALQSAGEPGDAFEIAVAAAHALGQDLTSFWRARLSANDARPWQELLDGADADTLDLVLAEAARLFPAELGADESGRPVPSTVGGRVLSALLAALAGAPGRGGPFVIAGLESPLAQHRNLALRALAAWSQDRWPEGAHERVARLATEDPEPSVRERAAAAWGQTAEA